MRFHYLRAATAMAFSVSVLVPILTVGGLIGTMQPVRASVFCAAEVVSVEPWDAVNDRQMNAPTRLYGFSIGADQDAAESGTLMVVTDKKAYAIPFSVVRLVPQAADPKMFVSTGHMFTLPEAARVLYAWVDDATDPKTGKDADCATLPLDVVAANGQTQATADDAQAGSGTLDRYQATPAAYKQDLPAIACGAMYTPPVAVSIPKETEYWDTSQGTKAKPVLVRVDLGSDGRVISVDVLGSSGSTIVDISAQDTFARGTYKAATFLCSPVASTLDYTYDYSIGR